MQSFDAQRIADSVHTVQIDESLLRRVSSGMGAFKPGTSTPKPGSTYYTISAMVLSASDINRAGLRNYIGSRKSIWLEANTSKPFLGWTPEDIDAARKYSAIKPYLYYSGAGVELSCAHTKQGWILSSTSDRPITWIPTDIAEHQAVSTRDKAMSTTWIRYGSTMLEIPVAKYSGLHCYNPQTDEFIVFYVYRTEVLDNLL